ncbi:MAG: glucose-1-phosphate cytidylyltransferase [Planctomycetota bacterium]|jgi:glucose-1-phosphate cytidylyltransferase
MKVVILCGGKGTRIREETQFIPKPLIQIGNKPILWHIMKTYAHYGFKDFILCVGYKGNMIKEYFLNYETINSDFTVQLGRHNSVKFHNSHDERDWRVTVVDTGDEAQTGARIKRVEKYIDGDLFMVTYGDGVANIDIGRLVRFHTEHKKIATITGVHPTSRFGELTIQNNRLVQFQEKPQVREGLINGGFFVFQRKFMEYLSDDDNCYLEGEPLANLASEGNLMIYTHDDFWQCVDTYREMQLLINMWKSPTPPWKVW